MFLGQVSTGSAAEDKLRNLIGQILFILLIYSFKEYHEYIINSERGCCALEKKKSLSHMKLVSN